MRSNWVDQKRKSTFYYWPILKGREGIPDDFKYLAVAEIA
jgi:hypothetical protein